MGVRVKKGVFFGGSSNSADMIMYDETTNVKKKIDEIESGLITTQDIFLSNLTIPANGNYFQEVTLTPPNENSKVIGSFCIRKNKGYDSTQVDAIPISNTKMNLIIKSTYSSDFTGYNVSLRVVYLNNNSTT